MEWDKAERLVVKAYHEKELRGDMKVLLTSLLVQGTISEETVQKMGVEADYALSACF